jgi:hypothetical protein
MIACEVGKIWLPQFANQFEATQKICEGYGFLAAANSSAPAAQPVAVNRIDTLTPIIKA